MAIPVNIEDLLHKCKIESTRIEFKTGCNPNRNLSRCLVNIRLKLHGISYLP